MTSFPKLNLNGTSYKELRAGMYRAYVVASELEAALFASMPHGRDFQTCDDPSTALAAAMAEHRIHLRAAKDCMAFFEAAILDLDQQNDARKTKR